MEYINFDREHRHYTFAHGRRPNVPSISDGAPRLIIIFLSILWTHYTTLIILVRS